MTLDAWVRHLQAAGSAPTTVRLRRSHVRRALAWIGRPVAEVTEADLEAFMAAHQWAAETRKGMRSSLRAYFSWAEQAGHIDIDPARRLPSVTVPQGAPHPAPSDVFDRAMDQAPPRTRLMLMLTVLSALTDAPGTPESGPLAAERPEVEVSGTPEADNGSAGEAAAT